MTDWRMARSPESAELKQARAELAKAQARVNELEWQADPGRINHLWRMVSFASGLPFFFIGMGSSSLLVYLGESAAAKSNSGHSAAFPTLPVIFLVGFSLMILSFLRLAARNPQLKEVPRYRRELRPALLRGAGSGLLLGLLCPLALGQLW